MGFAAGSKKTSKQDLGRTGVESTPIAIRSKIDLPVRLESTIRERLAGRIGHRAPLIERGTVRFEDINGPRGGTDTACRIKLVLSGRPSVQVEKRADSASEAFTAAIDALDKTLTRTARKHGLSAGRTKGHGGSSSPRSRARNGGSLVGRRVGRGVDAQKRALERPEKQRRDAYVDTASEGVSATTRKAGGHTTARRNTRGRTDRATVTLEDSRTQPSRKSTRRSKNRGKPSQGKERTAVARTVSPQAKASRAIAQRRSR